MKVKELPENTNLTDIKVELPSYALNEYKSYLGGEKEMWIVGAMMGDWFLSPDPKSQNKRTLFPMPITIEPRDILEWNVVDIEPRDILEWSKEEPTVPSE